MPMVEMNESENWSSEKRVSKLVLPTPESPIRTSLKEYSLQKIAEYAVGCSQPDMTRCLGHRTNMIGGTLKRSEGKISLV